jgi:alkylhydroperoxidase family enzyme
MDRRNSELRRIDLDTDALVNLLHTVLWQYELHYHVRRTFEGDSLALVEVIAEDKAENTRATLTITTGA